jgi:hypothetical protein
MRWCGSDLCTLHPCTFFCFSTLGLGSCCCCCCCCWCVGQSDLVILLALYFEKHEYYFVCMAFSCLFLFAVRFWMPGVIAPSVVMPEVVSIPKVSITQGYVRFRWCCLVVDKASIWFLLTSSFFVLLFLSLVLADFARGKISDSIPVGVLYRWVVSYPRDY